MLLEVLYFARVGQQERLYLCFPFFLGPDPNKLKLA